MYYKALIAALRIGDAIVPGLPATFYRQLLAHWEGGASDPRLSGNKVAVSTAGKIHLRRRKKKRRLQPLGKTSVKVRRKAALKRICTDEMPQAPSLGLQAASTELPAGSVPASPISALHHVGLVDSLTTPPTLPSPSPPPPVSEEPASPVPAAPTAGQTLPVPVLDAVAAAQAVAPAPVSLAPAPAPAPTFFAPGSLPELAAVPPAAELATNVLSAPAPPVLDDAPDPVATAPPAPGVVLPLPAEPVAEVLAPAPAAEAPRVLPVLVPAGGRVEEGRAGPGGRHTAERKHHITRVVGFLKDVLRERRDATPREQVHEALLRVENQGFVFWGCGPWTTLPLRN